MAKLHQLINAMMTVLAASAHPLSLVRRQSAGICGTMIPPHTVVPVNYLAPAVPGYNMSVFNVESAFDAGGNQTKQIATLVAFDPPAGHTACQLGVTFPAGQWAAGLVTAETAVLDVFKPDLGGDPGWVPSPLASQDVRSRGGPWGSVRIAPGVQYINSEDCAQADAYLFMAAENNGGAGAGTDYKAQFLNRIDGQDKEGSFGVFLHFDC